MTRVFLRSLAAMAVLVGMTVVCGVVGVAPVAIVAVVHGAPADWPQFLGPERNGVYTGPLARTWPAAGPRIVWRKPVGEGFAGPVVVSGRLILFHRVANEEVVESLEASTGAPQWKFAYPTTYKDDFGFDNGPRAVPVVVNGRIYTYGAEGMLHAIDLATGKKVWSIDLQKEYAPRLQYFGRAGSPLVEDGRVIMNVGDSFDGGGVMAFDVNTGKQLWQATKHEASHSSPVAATFDGKRRVVFMTRRGLLGLDPVTGAVIWDKEWRSRSESSATAASPIIVGNRIFISASYAAGAGVFEVVNDTLKEVWSGDESLSNHYATSVYRDGVLYGFHGRQEFGQAFRAVDFATGKVRWNEEQFKAGTVTLAGDRLLILRESGELLMAEATPTAFKPIARAKILPAVARGYPAISDGLLYARSVDSRNNELVCVDLR